MAVRWAKNIAAASSSAYPEVVDYASLPAATAHTGEIYIVQTTTGIIGFRKLAGLWRSDGASWVYLGLYGRNASEITNVPTGTVSSVDVQAAITELDGDIQSHIATGGFAHAEVTTGTAGFMSAADKVKLDGIAIAATANATDASLRDRSTHTGTQAQSTIVNLVTDLAGKQPLSTILTNTTASYTTAEQTKLSGIATAATANATDASLRDRTTHTGTQAQSTITNLTTDLAAKQPLDAQLTDIANLAYATNSLKVLRVNAGETGFELATLAGGGNVTGPASATDNAITRFDTASGTLLQNSAASVSDDGVIRSATNTGANAVAVPLMNWVMLTANYTLTSQTAAQKLFNTTANGALTLPTGVYRFKALIYLLSMSATSGNGAFSLAGTAVMDRFGYSSHGIDAASPLAAATQTGSFSITNTSPASIVTAGTGAGMATAIDGVFRVSTAGTIIPSISLVTAAAAIVQAGSWFTIEKIGESSETSVGAWT